MEVKIGIQQAQRELTVEVNDSAEAVSKLVADAIAGEGGTITLTDTKGRTIIVPGAKIAYVEIGSGAAGTVGFLR